MHKSPKILPKEDGGCDILHIEDDPDDRMLTREALQDLGISCRLLEAKDGAEALEMLRLLLSDGLPSVVLLDINLPKLRGHEVLRAIRADPRTRRVPVVMLTSSDSDSDVARSYDLGANGYVVKPVSFDAFAEMIGGLAAFWLRINRRSSSLPEPR